MHISRTVAPWCSLLNQFTRMASAPASWSVFNSIFCINPSINTHIVIIRIWSSRWYCTSCTPPVTFSDLLNLRTTRPTRNVTASELYPPIRLWATWWLSRLFKIKEHPPYVGDMEGKFLLNSMARSTFDPRTGEYSFQGKLATQVPLDVTYIHIC